MSLRGVISVEDTDNVGGFAAAVGKFKEGIGDITGVSMTQGSNKTPFGKLTIEGIVQGEIKLQAINDWKTTLFYGFSDAASNVGVSGTNASAILKFSNTVMNAMGYTLGGTGPASKKMYGGSNLNGFNLQFKWYTPYMEGWREAIRNLSFLAWPTTVFGGSDDDESALQQGVKTPNPSDKEQQENEYKQIIANCDTHRKAIQQFRAILDSCHAPGIEEADMMKLLGQKFGQGQKFGYKDLDQCAADAAQIAVSGESLFSEKIPAIEEKLRASFALDGVVMNTAKSRGELQLVATDIGNLVIDAKFWYDLGPEAPVNKSAPKLKSDGDKTQATKEANEPASKSALSAIPGGGLIAGSLKLADGVGDLLKGLMDSFAANPPIVNLKIYAGNELKYELSPLVIISFAITASRETINGDPVIVTIDISFDYYQVNATLAKSIKTRQTFAGVPIFRRGDE